MRQYSRQAPAADNIPEPPAAAWRKYSDAEDYGPAIAAGINFAKTLRDLP